MVSYAGLQIAEGRILCELQDQLENGLPALTKIASPKFTRQDNGRR